MMYKSTDSTLLKFLVAIVWFAVVGVAAAQGAGGAIHEYDDAGRLKFHFVPRSSHGVHAGSCR